MSAAKDQIADDMRRLQRLATMGTDPLRLAVIAIILASSTGTVAERLQGKRGLLRQFFARSNRYFVTAGGVLGAGLFAAAPYLLAAYVVIAIVHNRTGL